jgi:hypothetical protein
VPVLIGSEVPREMGLSIEQGDFDDLVVSNDSPQGYRRFLEALADLLRWIGTLTGQPVVAPSTCGARERENAG